MRKHDEDCDQYQAALAADGPYGNPYIEPTDYPCHCPKRVTITIDSPDEDGYYRVEVRRGPFNEALLTQGGYSSELAEILPDSKEIKGLFENWSDT